MNYEKIDIKRAVTEGKMATFSHYIDGNLWYVTEHAETFPVPTSDLGNATLNFQEKAIHLMRYMRKWNAQFGENT